MIPRRFLWLLDLLALVTAFVAARALTPALQPLFAPDGAASGLLAALGLPPVEFLGDIRPLGEVLWVLLLVAPITMLSLGVLGAYRPILELSRLRLIAASMAAPFAGLGLVTLIVFAMRSPRWSRLFVFLFTLLAGIALAGYRLALHWYRRRRLRSGFYARDVLLIGNTGAVELVARHLAERLRPYEYQIVGFLRLDPDQGPAIGADGVPLPALGLAGDLGDLLVHRPVHEVIAVQGSGESAWLREVVDRCDYFRLTLRIVPEPLLSGNLRDLQLLYHSDPLALPEIVLQPPELDSEAQFVKRVLDIVVSATALVLLSPVFLAVALAIKIASPGVPVFYRWRVIGYKGRPFTGYKFTTMVEDADQRREALMDRNEMSGPVFKMKEDPRVTPLGRFLRKYSLNELPQLWSVLKGDMSLVGPRPAFRHELERYDLWHKRKLSVRPGITCLWQVRGRNRISDFDEWVRMDLEYIDNWSLWLDVRILARTVWTVVAGTGY